MYKTIVWAMVCVSNNILNNFQCYSKNETIILLNDGNAAAVIEVDGRNSCWERTDRPANSFMFFFLFRVKKIVYIYSMYSICLIQTTYFPLKTILVIFSSMALSDLFICYERRKKICPLAKLMQVEWLQTPNNPVIVAIIIQKTIIRHLGILAKN